MTPEQIAELILQLGVAGIGFAFFWDERRAHRETIEKHRLRVQELQTRHIEDLREVAGLRQNLGPMQSYVRDAHKIPSSSEMKDVS